MRRATLASQPDRPSRDTRSRRVRTTLRHGGVGVALLACALGIAAQPVPAPGGASAPLADGPVRTGDVRAPTAAVPGVVAAPEDRRTFVPEAKIEVVATPEMEKRHEVDVRLEITFKHSVRQFNVKVKESKEGPDAQVQQGG